MATKEDQRLTALAVAQRLGVQRDTWFAWVHRGRAPAPDGREELSNKPWWYASTVDAWNSSGRPRQRVVVKSAERTDDVADRVNLRGAS